MKLRDVLLLTTATAPLLAGPLLAADPAPGTAPSATPTVRLGTGTERPGAGQPPDETLLLPGIDVVSQRLDQARSQLQPGLGATTYTFGRGAVETVPQGDNVPLNQLLLQAPGVAQDSFGQIHVRGDHNEVQFRLDGVQLPEGLSPCSARRCRRGSPTPCR